MKTLDQADVISVKDQELLRDVKNIIRGFLPTSTVLLYGSTARGTQRPESDYDILVLTDEPLSRQQEDRIEDEVYALELARGVMLATTYLTWDRWNAPIVRVSPFRKEVERDAVLI